MGLRPGAVCSICGKRFTVNDGGGFFFHLLHCDACGKAKEIAFDKLGEMHLRCIRDWGTLVCCIDGG
jgi:hypothetical protein